MIAARERVLTGAVAASAAHPHAQRQDEIDEDAECLLGCREHRHSAADLLHRVQALTVPTSDISNNKQ